MNKSKKIILSALVIAGALTITYPKKIGEIFRESNPVNLEALTEGLDQMRKSSNPLEEREVYEIPAGDYFVFSEDGISCSAPFEEFKTEQGKLLIVKKDSENRFKEPLKLKKDEDNNYNLKPGRYEVWIENNRQYTQIEEFEFQQPTRKQLFYFEGEELKPISDSEIIKRGLEKRVYYLLEGKPMHLEHFEPLRKHRICIHESYLNNVPESGMSPPVKGIPNIDSKSQGNYLIIPGTEIMPPEAYEPAQE